MVELEARTRAYLNGRANARRGVVLYQAIGRWLAIAHAAPRFTGHARRLAQTLREEFSTLNDLREALRYEELLADKPARPPDKEPARRGRKPNPNK